MKPITPRRHRALRLVACVLAGATISTAATAGEAFVPCEHPSVWPDAAVNAVIMPYRYIGTGRSPAAKTGAELTVLVQTQMLYSMLKYGGVGSTALATSEAPGIGGECSAEKVWRKILGQERKSLGQEQGARDQLIKGHGVVMLWGYLYEEGDDIIVQTYARFARREVEDSLTLSLTPGGDAQLIGRLPAEGFAFGARHITRQTLHEITRAFGDAAVLRTAPSNSAAPSSRVMLDSSRPFGYRVLEASGEWMKIESTDGKASGWIMARPPVAGRSLDEVLPELTLAEALVGYLRYRMALDGSAPHRNSERIVGWTRRALEHFYRSGGSAESPAAAATARVIAGHLDILSASGANTPDAVKRANAEYAKAAELMPYSAPARNLHTMTTFYGAVHGGPEKRGAGLVTTADEFMRTLALDPHNRDLLRNMDQLSRQMNTAPADTLLPGFRQRKAAVDKRLMQTKPKDRR